MKKHTHNLYGISGEGGSAREAKAMAEHRLKNIVENLDPFILSYKGKTLIVWVRENGAAYTITTPTDTDGRVYHLCMATDDRDTLVAYGIKHLLDYDRETGDMSYPAWVTTYMDKLAIARMLAEWESRDRFVRAYYLARQAMDHLMAHRWAGQHCHEPRFTAEPQRQITELAA